MSIGLYAYFLQFTMDIPLLPLTVEGEVPMVTFLRRQSGKFS